MSFDNIPAEMREYSQWIVWRLEKREGVKPTKVPYTPRLGSGKASVTDPATWGSFKEACEAPLTCVGVVEPDTPISATGFSGIGFVFTANDPFAGIDLDDTHGDAEAYQRQLKVYREFASYSELSPSRAGLHIIVKGELPHGRRRASIELYSSERYFTMTGDVQIYSQIEERQELLSLLFEQMGGPATVYSYGDDQEQKEPDETIIERASNAVNGDKFKQLYAGNWSSLYTSQSEADFALVDIVAFYTQNRKQIARIFRGSELGQRDKAARDDYVGYMVNKSFDRQLPPVDIDGLRIAFEAMRRERGGGARGEPGGTPLAPSDAGVDPTGDVAPASHIPSTRVKSFPPGLLGEVAQYILDAAPRPVPEIALAGAIALLSGICGRAYNVSGQGLNQYILMLSMTGAGKDAIASGIGKLMNAVCASVPSAIDFNGPGELVSSAGLIKWMDKKPAILCILGEFGVKLKEMSSPTANAHTTGLERVLLQIYSKSAHGNTLDPMAYSDANKNTGTIRSPSLTIIGESVPERFYEMLDDTMVASGLLPRFMVFEYGGRRVYLKEETEKVQPPFGLVQAVADLCAASLGLAHNGNVHNVPLNPEATVAFREFDKWTTDQINGALNENVRQLWNRAHLKALKLAAVCAIGINYISPAVTMNEYEWATRIIVNQTMKLIAKFEAGEIGSLTGSEAKQIADVIRTIGTRINSPHEAYDKYGDSAQMHNDGVITQSHIQRRLVAQAAFRLDKFGATNAIKRSLQMLLDSDELKEVPKAQMQMKYGTGPRAFVIADPRRFHRAAKDYEAKRAEEGR